MKKNKKKTVNNIQKKKFWEIKCQKVKITVLTEINFQSSIKDDNNSNINY